MANNILKEAIADAKAVREVALANAKAALEEAFTPKLQSMLSAKLSEELDSDEEIELDEVQSLAIDAVGSYGREKFSGSGDIEENLDEVVDLEAILNELELEEGADADEETVDEAKKDDDKEEVKEEKDKDDDKEELDEMQVIYNAETANDIHYTADSVNEGCTDCDDNFDLDSLLEEINKVDLKENRFKKEPINKPFYVTKLKQTQKELNTVKTELNETKTTLISVKGELNEVNLLNSKLLYVNRIFKANSLNDGQKLRVVESLDKAGSVKEAKLIYETIKDTFSIKKNTKLTPKRKSIKENFGMASKAAGISTAPKQVISEASNMVTRMQKLANIKISQ
jgi:hypothetical protein